MGHLLSGSVVGLKATSWQDNFWCVPCFPGLLQPEPLSQWQAIAGDTQTLNTGLTQSLWGHLIAKFRLKVGKTTTSFRYDLNKILYNYTVERTNRFKGLDLIDKVPEELWMEVHNIVQEAMIKTIPKKKKGIFIGKTDAEAEASIPWLPDGNNGLLRKDPDARKDWR